MIKKYISLLITLLLLTIIYVGYYIATGSFIPCLIHKYTGYYCSACGITRMLISIIHLDLYQAFRFNPYLFVLICLLPIVLIIKKILNINKNVSKKVNIFLSIFFIVSFILFGIFRNLDNFSYLLPTIVK